MPKGYVTAKTLDKLAAREETRKMITAALGPMIRAQIAHATGIGHLYTRDKAGKFNKIESQARVDELLATGTQDTDYWIFTKDPSVQAFSDLVNRALDKAKEQEIDVNVSKVGDMSNEELLAMAAALALKMKGE